MNKRFLALVFCLIPMLASANNHYPCLDLTNKTDDILTIRHDPNWDDQQLIVNGHQQHNLNVDLLNGKKIEICGLWYQFGIDFYSKNFFTFVEVSNEGNQLASISETYPPNTLNYHILEQSNSLLKIELYSTR